MTCKFCKKSFKDGDRIVPVEQFVESSRGGFFVGNVSEYIHYTHLLAVM